MFCKRTEINKTTKAGGVARKKDREVYESDTKPTLIDKHQAFMKQFSEASEAILHFCWGSPVRRFFEQTYNIAEVR